MIAMIISCEIAFWVFVVAGLAFRYVFSFKKTGVLLLYCTPLIDLALLVATVIHLRGGAEASAAHGIAAIYIGVSIAFGHSMIRWADTLFAHRFASGPAPEKKTKYGKGHARNERHGWYRHLAAWVIGCAILYGMIILVNEPDRTTRLLQFIRTWSFVLAIDFLISFSYTLFPRAPKKKTS